jgi:hypothetical protein
MTRPIKAGKVTTVDMQTGAVVKTRQNAMTLLPPAPGRCPECAVEHDYFAPHNQQSLYYQMQFQAKHGRWPTWTDALAHCPPEVRAEWRKQLVERMRAHGLDVPADLQGPEQGPARR